ALVRAGRARYAHSRVGCEPLEATMRAEPHAAERPRFVAELQAEAAAAAPARERRADDRSYREAGLTGDEVRDPPTSATILVPARHEAEEVSDREEPARLEPERELLADAAEEPHGRAEGALRGRR